MMRLPVCSSLILLAVLSGLLYSCRPELDYVDNTFRSDVAALKESGGDISVVFRSDSGSASLDLTASGTWKAEFVNGRAYWCTLSQTEGKRGVATLTFTVQANGEYEDRSASVLFTCGKLQRTIVVTQKQRDAMLLSSGRVEMDSDGGSFTVEVMSNIDFSHRIEPDGSGWIRAVPTKGLEKSILTFSVDPNTSLDRRSGTVIFEGAAGPEELKIYQKGEVPTIVISEGTVPLPAEEGTFRVEVASNIDAELVVPESCAWLKELRTKTISTNTYLFSYDRNHSRSERVCELVFRNEGFSTADTVRIEQKCADILLSSGEIYVPSVGDTVSFLTAEQVSNPSMIKFDASWLKQVGTEPGEGGLRYLFRVGQNKGDGYREMKGRISRPGFDSPEEFTVCQFGQRHAFTYTESRSEVTAPEIKDMTSPAIILWGDGKYEFYEIGLSHKYGQDGPHTIRIEGKEIPLFMIHSLQDGMRFDFSKIAGAEQ
ncbi:MAG: BACON domain-containing protein [Bacteroidales bacterium]|nr:BACON domain-containing protein [Bacteroidales bacterium]